MDEWDFLEINSYLFYGQKSTFFLKVKPECCWNEGFLPRGKKSFLTIKYNFFKCFWKHCKHKSLKLPLVETNKSYKKSIFHNLTSLFLTYFSVTKVSIEASKLVKMWIYEPKQQQQKFSGLYWNDYDDHICLLGIRVDTFLILLIAKLQKYTLLRILSKALIVIFLHLKSLFKINCFINSFFNPQLFRLSAM